MALHKKIILAVAFFLGSACGVAAEELPVIRMVVADKIKDCTIGVAGPFCVLNGPQVLLDGNYLPDSPLRCVKGKIYIGEKRLSDAKILLQAQDSDIRAAGKSFAPHLEIIPVGADRLLLVSVLGLEEYTMGVVRKEIEPAWPMEVLKAQAVLIRTNAVWAYLKNKRKLFHLSCWSPQVYERAPQVHSNVASAVDETRGLILMYDDQVIPAYFHAVCGGGTEAAKNVWQQSSSYPAAVRCNFCREAPKFHWNRRVSLAEFQRRLAAAGLPIGEVQSVFASKTSAVSDRITEVVIEHAGGKILLRTNTLRGILGHNEIRSTNFSVTRKGADLVFKGRGWGHGVGLCQWGARAMAKEGKDFEDILKFYYPGARIGRVKE